MKVVAGSVLAATLALGFSALNLVAQQAPQTVAIPPLPAAQMEANKKVAMEFYRPGITPEERIALIHADYQQHNQTYVKYAKDHKVSNFQAFAEIRRQQGRDQAAAAAAARASLEAKGPLTPAQAPVGNTFHILYTEGEYVVRIAQRWTADPASPGSFYETFFWDTFQVRDGKLYQHWDAGVIADPNAPPNPNPAPAAAASTVPVVWPPAAAVPTPGCSATPEQVAANKKVAMEFFRDGITAPERIALVDPNYVQHNPQFRLYALQNKINDYETLKIMATRNTPAPGAPGAPRPQVQGPQPPAGNPFERVIGACDIVTLIHKVYSQDPTMPAGNFYDRYTFDTFRVRNGKLTEHWDGTARQAPAPTAARAN